MGLTLTWQASLGRVLRRRTAGGSEQVAGPGRVAGPKDASHRPPVTGHQGAPMTISLPTLRSGWDAASAAHSTGRT